MEKLTREKKLVIAFAIMGYILILLFTLWALSPDKKKIAETMALPTGGLLFLIQNLQTKKKKAIEVERSTLSVCRKMTKYISVCLTGTCAALGLLFCVISVFSRDPDTPSVWVAILFFGFICLFLYYLPWGIFHLVRFIVGLSERT